MQGIHIASAIYPGMTHLAACQAVLDNAPSETIGTLNPAHFQLCPQHPSPISEEALDAMQALLPDSRFRPHANVRVWEHLTHYDASSAHTGNGADYFKRLAELSAYMHAPALSIHAGYTRYADLERMADNLRWLNEDVFTMPVAVESLYPNKYREQLLQNWAQHAWLLDSDLPFALDLSHLKIIASAEGGYDWDLMRALLQSPLCLEVHVSDNNGSRDAHEKLRAGRDPEWLPLLPLAYANPNTVVFSESCQRKAARRKVAA